MIYAVALQTQRTLSALCYSLWWPRIGKLDISIWHSLINSFTLTRIPRGRTCAHVRSQRPDGGFEAPGDSCRQLVLGSDMAFLPDTAKMNDRAEPVSEFSRPHT